MSKLSPDAWEALTPVVRALERLEVDYYLGGSIASSAYGLASAEDVVLSKLEWFRLGNEVSQSQWRDVIGVLQGTPAFPLLGCSRRLDGFRS